jgi:hypothetical protein
MYSLTHSLLKGERKRKRAPTHPKCDNWDLKVMMMGMALTTGLRPTWRCTWVQ